jgi:hypothetical protein
MVNPAKARDEGDESSDKEDQDDLANEAETGSDKNGTGSTKAPPQGDAAGDKEKNSDTDDEGDDDEATRLRNELAQVKKNNRALTRKLNDVLAKVGATDTEGADEIVTRAKKAEKRVADLERRDRQNQKVEAVREVLSTEKYRDYAPAVKYIVPILDLDDDTDITDDGRYDAEALSTAAKQAVKQYAEDNPRPRKSEGAGGGPGGEAQRKGGLPRNEEEELARLEGMFGVKLR